MKIAIIGATGHVGSAVTAGALRQDHEVTAILRLNAPQIRANSTVLSRWLNTTH